ncbi:histidine--tRNA ligase [Mycoplasmopsis gallopavonis]|uniref:Histidine--tRNA ligase n=1 Tax=Mycoplasmopsis gallopavonis TaxID=76629 RepID=A0A449AYZ0_9BACT|nr:histidine--tRNA ligase [Mycoplasmopsis gallopavonis]RIV16922.1 histidine--tRNA ligase [Mycoplasmopsis gallopavonis]VEU72743.1 histidyl-tRNA synthetase [Mycoplasmopsis gallopavonis]
MLNKVKGTKDYEPIEFQVKQIIYETFWRTAKKFGYVMIETPILESSNLFKRSVGDDSDIVNKEMYEFKDKGDRDICLRPEGTASFVRALIENKWYANYDKFAYFGPMFRYEQPQKGRYRQFYQAGFEFVAEKNYVKDAELIFAAYFLLLGLNIESKLIINCIGDKETRKNYEKALKEYLLPYKDQLNQISQQRLEKGGVLRILDDKMDSKHKFIKNAPKIKDFLSPESKEYFKKLTEYLEILCVDFEISNELVRGLDYYDEIVFEFVSTSKNTGSQGTIIGGGRYNNLIKELDGPELSSIGFALGVDRLISIFKENILNAYEIENSLNNHLIYLAASHSEESALLLNKLANLFLRFVFDSIKVEFKVLKPKKVYEKAKKYNAEILISDDIVNGTEMLMVKHLPTNDSIHVTKTTESFIDIIRFMADKQVENVDPDEIEELIEGVFENE